jgi:ubiquinone/menaquinone biosynthesis C-methylase UbiE
MEETDPSELLAGPLDWLILRTLGAVSPHVEQRYESRLVCPRLPHRACMRLSAGLASLLACAVCFGACSAPPTEQSASSPRAARATETDTHHLFSAFDLSLLETPDRDQWQRIDDILDDLKIADGSTVADIAAGGGWFSVRLARRVGPAGVVYAEEIQSSMIESISGHIRRENLTNIRPVLGTPTDPHLPLDSFDAVVIVNAFHDIDTPEPLLHNIQQALKDRGVLGVVDFTPGGGGPGPDANERVAPATIVSAAEAANLRLIERHPVPPFEFLLIFGK